MTKFVSITKEIAPSLPDSFFSQAIKDPTNTELDSVYVFTLHKCASTMLERIFSEIAIYNGLGHVQVDPFCYSNDYKLSQSNIQDLKNIILPKGYLYGVLRQLGFEQAPNFEHFDIDNMQSILIVRDPRDILTSHYFSMYFSHEAPGKLLVGFLGDSLPKMDIDEFVLGKMPFFKNNFDKNVKQLLPKGNCKLFRYEDIIADLEKFIFTSVDHLGLCFPIDKARSLGKKETQKPKKENIHRHIRKVIPGDHKEKLKSTTIQTLNKSFKDILSIFDYKV